MAAEPGPRRHDLAILAPVAWTRLLEGGFGAVHEALVARWAAFGWPLVVRRRLPADPPGTIPLGLPLPPATDKARLACALVASDIIRFDPPPTLVEAMGAAPPPWRAAASELLALGSAAGIVPRVFGSLAWASLTGLEYVRPGSDLDLIWPLRADQDPAPLLRSLHDLQRRAPMRLDGELVLPDGRAVNWLELASPAAELLVKTTHRVALVSRGDLFTAGMCG